METRSTAFGGFLSKSWFFCLEDVRGYWLLTMYSVVVFLRYKVEDIDLQSSFSAVSMHSSREDP